MIDLTGKTVLVTGGARRIGKSLVIAAAKAGADVIIHYNQSHEDAEGTCSDVLALGRRARLLCADLSNPREAAGVIPQALDWGPLFGLVNNAAIFEQIDWNASDLESWNRHLMINLSAPLLLSQAFARSVPPQSTGRIINILDWRALRPGRDHLPYTVSKAGLAALTRSLAQSLAPNITVNGLALGAILPPSDGADSHDILENVPAGRWAELDEVEQAFEFLLRGPDYLTGEIIHLDGGRHVV
ncbi:MAG: hypothetical protein A2Z16_12450 [Chloroflexi bacterium RBG_16_54_18]|nr:MAG: hypothetical protein A2Z16_12450 [Chloroflexi bacterium RBG_16_54_18]